MNPDLWPTLAVLGAFGSLAFVVVGLVRCALRVGDVDVLNGLLEEDPE